MSIEKRKDEQITIFHVDDDDLFLELTKINLEELDSRIVVLSEYNPQIVMEKLKHHHDDYDVVICDYDMKNLDGLEILKELRNRGSDIAFIILTGKGREEIVIQALNLGADYYLQKSSDSVVMFAELRHYILSCVEMKKEKLKKKIAKIRYKYLFDESPAQSWLEDLSEIKILIDELNNKNIADIREYIEDHPEIVRDSIKKIKIIDANKAAIESVGAKSKEDILGGLDNIIGAGAFNIVKEEIIALAEGKKNFQLESLVDTTERGRIYFDLRFSVVPGYENDMSRVLVSSVDVTELVNERNTLQQYLDVAGVMFIALDANGTVNLINRKGCEILGYKEKAIIGRNWFDTFIAKEDTDQIKEVFAEIMKGDIKPAEYHENNIIAKGGEKRLIAWHNSIIRNHKGEIIGSLSSGEDVTDSKKIELSLKEQMEETELFLSIITHDLKNYHHSSKGFNELIINSELNQSKIIDYAKKSNAGITRASNLLNNISVLMRDKLDKGYELYPVNIKESVDSVKKKVNDFFSTKKIQYNEDIDQNAHVYADSLFEYLLLNLFTNAVKNDENDVIQIEVTTKINSTDNCLLSVSDHGRGIPPEMRRDIFSKYTEFRKKGKGSGLGLHIIKTLVDRYGGKVWIESRLPEDHEKGTTFKITLKSHEEETNE